MKLFIDGEWNSWQGDLISFAVVSEDGHVFYEVLGCKWPDPWIRENVMPKLRKPEVDYDYLQGKLARYLSQFDAIHVVADWPEDIEWFCHLLITGPGERLDTPPMTMEVLRVDTVSADPHNALADAHTLRSWYLEQAT